jgi:hypothetical protein
LKRLRKPCVSRCQASDIRCKDCKLIGLNTWFYNRLSLALSADIGRSNRCRLMPANTFMSASCAESALSPSLAIVASSAPMVPLSVRQCRRANSVAHEISQTRGASRSSTFVCLWPGATVIARQPNVRFRKYSVSRRRSVYPPNTPQSRRRLSD